MDGVFSRRTFLQAAGCTVAAAAGERVPDRSKTPRPWRMRLSTSSIHFMELPIEQACERIARLGFEAIDIWSGHEGCPHLDDVARRLGPVGLKELLARHRLKLCAFSVYSGGYARYAELLGGVGGGVAIQGSAPPCEPAELIPRMRQFLEGLKPLIDLAERHKSFLAIENHGSALLDGVDSLKAFVDLNRSKRLGIALAPYHLQARGQSVPEAIRICGHRLLFFYAWQRQPDQKQLPGLGPTDMLPWLEALRDIRYRHYVNPFAHAHPGTERMAQDLARARGYLVEGYRRICPEGAARWFGAEAAHGQGAKSEGLGSGM